MCQMCLEHKWGQTYKYVSSVLKVIHTENRQSNEIGLKKRIYSPLLIKLSLCFTYQIAKLFKFKIESIFIF